MREPFSHAKLLKLLVYGAAAAVIALAPTGASAGKFKVLHSFCSKAGCADGEKPESLLVSDVAGNLFGTAGIGGVHNFGTAFELQNVGSGKYKFKVIFAYSAPSLPSLGGLTIDAAGDLYGFNESGEFYKLSYGFGAHHDKWGLTEQEISCSGSCGTDPIWDARLWGPIQRRTVRWNLAVVRCNERWGRQRCWLGLSTDAEWRQQLDKDRAVQFLLHGWPGVHGWRLPICGCSA